MGHVYYVLYACASLTKKYEFTCQGQITVGLAFCPRRLGVLVWARLLWVYMFFCPNFSIHSSTRSL